MSPALHGDANVRDLERRFVTAEDRLHVAGAELMLLRPRNSDDLIREEDFVRDERLPYWADVWPSSLILAERVGGEDGRGRRALELGCGLGVVTVAAMAAGYDVLATDYYEDALDFTRANAWRALVREPATRMVDWRDFPADIGRFDRILASDVLYEHHYAPLLARAIATTLARGGAALIADPGRVAAAAFLDDCGSLGLTVSATTHPYEAGAIRQTITVYELRRQEDA